MKQNLKRISKKQLIDDLENNNYSKKIIDRVKNLPEKIEKNNIIYDINIISSDINYEINYFSFNDLEFFIDWENFHNITENLNKLENEIKKI